MSCRRAPCEGDGHFATCVPVGVMREAGVRALPGTEGDGSASHLLMWMRQETGQ